MEAPIGAHLDWIVWRAIQMADEQGLDWMRDHLRSAATIGAYVLARPGGDENSPASVTQSDSLPVCMRHRLGRQHHDHHHSQGGRRQPRPRRPSRQHQRGSSRQRGAHVRIPLRRRRLPSATTPTDSNGQVFISLNNAGGHDTAATLLVYVAPDTIPVAQTTIEAKSPDITGDGAVSTQDFVISSQEYSQSGSWLRSDFNYNGTVDVNDFITFGQRYNHSCSNRRTDPIPPELLALLGMGEGTDYPDRYELGQCMPNPFNPVTVIGYAVPSPGGEVSISVYDVAGRRVATLVDAESSPGWFATTWDGTSSTGDRVSSGVYFCKMEAPGFSDTKKLTLLK